MSPRMKTNVTNVQLAVYSRFTHAGTRVHTRIYIYIYIVEPALNDHR